MGSSFLDLAQSSNLGASWGILWGSFLHQLTVRLMAWCRVATLATHGRHYSPVTWLRFFTTPLSPLMVWCRVARWELHGRHFMVSFLHIVAHLMVWLGTMVSGLYFIYISRLGIEWQNGKVLWRFMTTYRHNQYASLFLPDLIWTSDSIDLNWRVRHTEISKSVTVCPELGFLSAPLSASEVSEVPWCLDALKIPQHLCK